MDNGPATEAIAPGAPEAKGESWITVGRIVAAQGMNGEVRVYPESDFPDRFLVAGERWLRRPGQAQPESVKLKQGRYIPKKNLYVVKFEGINYRDQAEALRDVELLVPESDRPELDDGEFHVLDLVGLEVFLQDTGESIGRVVDLISVGNDLLEIELTRLPESESVSDSAGAEAEEAMEPSLELTPSLEPLIAAEAIESAEGLGVAEGCTDLEAGETAAKAEEKAQFTRRKGRRKAAIERRKAARPTKAPRLLVPFVHAIVPVVDLAAGRIEITPPPGLLDLSR